MNARAYNERDLHMALDGELPAEEARDFEAWLAANPDMQAKSGRFSIFSELWSFMKVRKKWWLGPIVVTMLLLSVLIVLTQGSAVAPFIYALF